MYVILVLRITHFIYTPKNSFNASDSKHLYTVAKFNNSNKVFFHFEQISLVLDNISEPVFL